MQCLGKTNAPSVPRGLLAAAALFGEGGLQLLAFARKTNLCCVNQWMLFNREGLVSWPWTISFTDSLVRIVCAFERGSSKHHLQECPVAPFYRSSPFIFGWSVFWSSFSRQLLDFLSFSFGLLFGCYLQCLCKFEVQISWYFEIRSAPQTTDSRWKNKHVKVLKEKHVSSRGLRSQLPLLSSAVWSAAPSPKGDWTWKNH